MCCSGCGSVTILYDGTGGRLVFIEQEIRDASSGKHFASCALIAYGTLTSDSVGVRAFSFPLYLDWPSSARDRFLRS